MSGLPYVTTLSGLFVLITFNIVEMEIIGGSKGGRQGRAPPLWIRILSFSCSFQEIFDQIIGLHPHLVGWRPLLWEILDPPLEMIMITVFTCSWLPTSGDKIKYNLYNP